MLADLGGEESEITATPFRAMVKEGEPFRFAETAQHDTQVSVRLTHLIYTPPTSQEALALYLSAHPTESSRAVYSVAAKVRTLTASNKIESFVVACFPCVASRVSTIEADSQHLASSLDGLVGKPSSIEESKTVTSSVVRLGGRYDTVLPQDTDIAANLNIRLDVDGSVELEVEGPGYVTFFGEQFSSLVPEWMNHRFFNVNEDDEEEDVDSMDDDEMEEMIRLAR